MRLIVMLLLLLHSALIAQEYRWGEGYNIPQTPVYIGGYATLDYVTRADSYNRFRVDELAFLSYANFDRFSYMFSLEMKESYVKEWGLEEDLITSDRVSLERLYIDYAVSDVFTLRAGKFNTPAGYWNMEPINILRDTSSIVYTSFLLFPRYATGLEFKYDDPLYSSTSYSLVLQANRDLDDYYNNISVDKHFLLGVEHLFSDAFKMKLNLGYFETFNAEPYLYGLVSLAYDSEHYSILSEFGSRRDSKFFRVPYNFYLQGAWHIDEVHHLVGRFEAYKIDEGAFREEIINILGYTYRPTAPFTFKIEYRDHSYVNENQIRTSVSVMF